MQPEARHKEIVSLLARHGEIGVERLASLLSVSRETVRRDLTALDAQGQIRKFHGGARFLDSTRRVIETEGPFADRMAHNAGAKRRIAATAKALFAPGDSIFLDTGSTTIFMAEALAQLSLLTVITNSAAIARIVAGSPTNKVFMIGGAFSVDANENVGPLALEQIARFRARHVVLTVGAIDADGIMDYDLQETEVARAMIDRADRLTVLADHSKFDRRAVFDVAPIARIGTLVTDRVPDLTTGSSLATAGVSVVVAD